MNNIFLDNPFYFYSLVMNPEKKNIDNEIGLMSPRYMYDHDKTYLLDGVLDPWRRVIVNTWGMYPQDPDTLTRREVMDAMDLKLGPEYLNSIFFFRYVPSQSLGWQTKLILSKAKIYRIDLNDTNITNYIRKEDIMWGRDKRFANRQLNRLYWQNITSGEYFKFYKDNMPVFNRERLLDQLNQIHVIPKQGYIPKAAVVDMTNKLNLDNVMGGSLNDTKF